MDARRWLVNAAERNTDNAAVHAESREGLRRMLEMARNLRAKARREGAWG